jgi:hypothetical protein
LQTDVRRKSCIFHPADNDICSSDRSRAQECPLEEAFAIRYLVHAINAVLELSACLAKTLIVPNNKTEDASHRTHLGGQKSEAGYLTIQLQYVKLEQPSQVISPIKQGVDIWND